MCRSKKHEVREANMYFFVEATIAFSVILSYAPLPSPFYIDLVSMCRSKNHEMREANMYFFVEATIALSVILSYAPLPSPLY
jgi:hypothetical protein